MGFLDPRAAGVVIFMWVCICIVCVIAILSCIFIKTWNLDLHNKFMDFTQTSYLTTMVYMMERNRNIQLELSGVTDEELPFNENALVLPNHQSHDWAHIFMLAYRKGNLGGVRTVLKGSTVFIPGFGLSMYLNNWPFVSRDWKKDKSYLATLFQGYRVQNNKLVLWLFPEGTRITKKKLAKSQAYAQKTGKPHFEHCMLPRYKAFISSVHGLRGVVEYVYDVTLSYDGWEDSFPGIVGLLFSKATGKYKLQLHVKKWKLSDLPVEDDELRAWLLDTFKEKDQRLQYRQEHGVLSHTNLRCMPHADLKDFTKHLVIWGSLFSLACVSSLSVMASLLF